MKLNPMEYEQQHWYYSVGDKQIFAHPKEMDSMHKFQYDIASEHIHLMVIP